MQSLSTISDATKARLASVSIYHVCIPLRKPVVHASHARTESENIVVACRLTDGTVGFGEGVPRDYVTGETVDSCWDLLGRANYSALSDDVRTPAEAVALARKIDLPRLDDDPRDCKTNVARCALELALLDAFGRSLGYDVLTMLQVEGTYREILSPRRSCRYSGVITSKPSLKKEVMSALKMRFNWFPCVKVKVGTQGQDDRRRLKLFRKLVGTIDIRVDANEAWSPSEAAQRIAELEPAKISAVEQPLRHEDFAALPTLRQAVDTPIMLDESLCSVRDGERAIEDKACDIFNIRLSKCGGMIRSLDLALLAHRAGLGYQLGCQVGETGILSAAGRTFACGVQNIRYAEGSYDQYLVKERLTRENLTFEWRGWAPRLKGTGLGMTVEPERLRSVLVREATLYG
ncbi:dipeptide epimerase [bacterium]|jgi:L-Ala-D/L-Glu epimerase|nr:dipeptide epimerase [bacterium]